MIKYKAWEIEKERWITPSIEDEEESELRLTPWGDLTFRLPWHEQEHPTITTVSGNESFELTRFSGMEDCNGVEVYEGDIIYYPMEILGKRELTHVVEFEHGSFCIWGELLVNVLTDGGYVVGNIKEGIKVD